MFKTKSGGYGFNVMSIDDVRNHAQKYSQAYNSQYSPWSKNFDEMAKKTVLKACLKYAPIKTEFVRALTTDETIKSNLSDNMADVDDETIDTEVVTEETTVEEVTIQGETGEILEENK